MMQIIGPSVAPVILSPLEELLARIEDRSAIVGIVGLGYVGLPLAVEFARTFAVRGFDANADRLAQLAGGKSHILDVPDAAVASMLDRERFAPTSDFRSLADCDAVIICVPTPLEKSKEPDLSYINAAVANVASALRPGQLVVLESTTYPGTTDELLLPRLAQRGYELDKDFLVAFSPERVDPGSSFELREIAKVVGGCSEASTRAACALYRTAFTTVHPVSSARVAETVKLLENTFRFVNIGLVNEFAQLCSHLSIDTNEVIAAAATKPFGFMPFLPGPGIGGHCIPLDPLYLSWKANQQGFRSQFIELADRINSEMPAYVVDRVAELLNDGEKAVKNARILVVGVAYKENIEDTRQSPAIAIIDRLRARGANVAYHDPYVPVLDFDFHDWPEWRPRVTMPVDRRALRIAANGTAFSRRRYDKLSSIDLNPHAIAEADCIVILTRHAGVDYDLIARNARAIVDTRAAIPQHLDGATVKVIRL